MCDISDPFCRTDIGNVGRNVLRGPNQSCVDFSVLKRWPIRESSSLEFRADFFNLVNPPNRNNPIGDISVVAATGGSVDEVTGRILSPGDFGRIMGVSSSHAHHPIRAEVQLLDPQTGRSTDQEPRA